MKNDSYLTIKHQLLLVLIFILGNNLLFAQVKLPALFSDGMVLQRTKKIPVWGWAQPGSKVHILFNGKTYQTQTKADSTWAIKLKAMDAGGPYIMTVNDDDATVTIKDVMIGDVFVCSGQSNMEFTMAVAKSKYPDEIAAAANPNIRQFLVVDKYQFTPAADVKSVSGWQSANPQTVLKFTAVGYFFAKALYEKYHVPIGLIHASWGGVPIETWMSLEALNDFPKIKQQAENLKSNMRQIKVSEAAMVAAWNGQALQQEQSFNKQKAFEPTPDEPQWKPIVLPGTWKNDSAPKNGSVTWLKKAFTVQPDEAGKPSVLMLGAILEEDSTYINGIKVGSTGDKYHERKYYIPAGLIKGGTNYISVRVVSNYGPGSFVADNKFYQLILPQRTIDLKGEWQYREVASLAAQASRPTVFQSQPTGLFDGMMSPLIPYGISGFLWYQGEANAPKAMDYRKQLPAMITDWRNKWGDEKLPFLYVQLANFGPLKDQPAESQWAELREAQTITLSLPNTGMAVTHDIGEYNNIHPLNKADVGKRLALAAEKLIYKESLVYSGPIYKGMQIDGNRIIVTFNQLGGGLITKNNEPVKYISIAGADKKFVWAKAKIEDNKLIVWSDTIAEPVAVRYAWAESPDGANLYNKEGLPASSFRTDITPGPAAGN